MSSLFFTVIYVCSNGRIVLIRCRARADRITIYKWLLSPSLSSPVYGNWSALTYSSPKKPELSLCIWCLPAPHRSCVLPQHPSTASQNNPLTPGPTALVWKDTPRASPAQPGKGRVGAPLLLLCFCPLPCLWNELVIALSNVSYRLHFFDYLNMKIIIYLSWEESFKHYLAHLPCCEQGPAAARPVCLELGPAWLWMSPGQGHPPSLWATCLVLQCAYYKKNFFFIFYFLIEEILRLHSKLYVY